MKQKYIRHGWLKVLCAGWIIAGSVWADDNSTNSPSVSTNSVQNQTSIGAPLESAASQKIYGVNSNPTKVIEPKPVSLMEVMLRIFGALLIVTAILFGGAWGFRKSRMFGLVSAPGGGGWGVGVCVFWLMIDDSMMIRSESLFSPRPGSGGR